MYPDFDSTLYAQLIHPAKEVVFDTMKHVEELRQYLKLAFSCKIHPLGYLMSILGKYLSKILNNEYFAQCIFVVHCSPFNSCINFGSPTLIYRLTSELFNRPHYPFWKLSAVFEIQQNFCWSGLALVQRTGGFQTLVVS